MFKKSTKRTVMALALLAGVAALAVVAVQPVQAIEVWGACSGNTTNAVCNAGGADTLFGTNSIWTRIINTILFVAGAIAVLMVIIGGIKYIVSAGDQSGVTSAKNTILYALVGLGIVVVSYAIVNFVIQAIV